MVEVPLSPAKYGGFTELTEAPPSLYCGADVDESQEHYYTEEKEYQIKAWGYSVKFGNKTLVNVVDQDGKQIKGKVQIRIPYCPVHIQPVKSFKFVDMAALFFGIIVGLIPFFLANRAGWEGWIMLFLLFALPIGSAILFYLIGIGIKAIIAKAQPK